MPEIAAPNAPASTPSPRTRYTWKRALAFAFFVFVMSACILVGGKFYIVYVTPASIIAQEGSVWEGGMKTMQAPGEVAFGLRDRLNILCLGVDYNYDNKDQHHTKFARSDTIFILSIDKRGQVLNIVSIPRDLRVEIPGVGTDKINAAFANKETGDVPLARKTVEALVGVPMDHTVVIKEYAAQAVVNAVGGVTVNVEKNMDYDDNWGHLHIHLKKGVQKLNGEQSVGYVRFRHDEEGDRGRIRRQQQFIDALLRELKKPSYTTYNEVAKVFKENIQTDLTIPEMIDIANVYRKFDRKKIKTAKLDGDDVDIGGVSFIQPNDREIRRTCVRMLSDRQGFFPDEVKVQVLNGSDVKGAARAFADVLLARGYDVIDVDSTRKPAEETYIEDHRNLPQADQALQTLMGQTLIVDGRSKVNQKADITIVLGKDWAHRYKAYEAQGAALQASPSADAIGRPAVIPTTDVPAPQVPRMPSTNLESPRTPDQPTSEVESGQSPPAPSELTRPDGSPAATMPAPLPYATDEGRAPR